MNYTVYLIQGPLPNHRYVGCTRVALKKRFINHKTDARNGAIKSQLACTIREYGVQNFSIEILRTGMGSGNYAEAYWVKKLDTLENGLNMMQGGDKSAALKGREFSSETRAKLAKAQTGRKYSKDARAKVSAANRRRWQDPAYRKKMAAYARARSGIHD
jgi:group I intron endonuclease